MSPGRDDMFGRTAKVKPGPALPPQGPGGRFQGTCVPGPSSNGAWRWGDSEVFLEQKRQIDTPGLPGLLGSALVRVFLKAGMPEISSSRPRRRPCSSRSLSCYIPRWRTTAHIVGDVEWYGPGNTWPPTQDITVSHCNLCSRSRGGGVLCLRHEARDEGGHLTPAPGVRDSIQKGVEFAYPLSRGKGQQEEHFLGKKTFIWCPQRLVRRSSQALKDKRCPTQGDATPQVWRTSRNL